MSELRERIVDAIERVHLSACLDWGVDADGMADAVMVVIETALRDRIDKAINGVLDVYWIHGLNSSDFTEAVLAALRE